MNLRSFFPPRSAAPVLSFMALALGALSVQADDFYIWAEEEDGDVVFFFEGSFDLTGFPGGTLTAGLNPVINPSFGIFHRESSLTYNAFPVLPPVSMRTFGAGGLSSTDSAEGDVFALTGSNRLALPLDYESGSPLRGSITFESTTLALLGVDATPFSFETTSGDNTIYLFTIPPATEAPPMTATTGSPAVPDLQIGKKPNRLKGNDRYDRRRASNRQTLKCRARIFTTNTQKAALLLQNDGGTAARFSLKSSGDQLPRMKATARSGGKNVSAAVKTGRFSPVIAPGGSVAVGYQLRTNRFYAGVLRDGDRDDAIRFRLSGAGQRDNVAMVVKYRGQAGG